MTTNSPHVREMLMFVALKERDKNLALGKLISDLSLIFTASDKELEKNKMKEYKAIDAVGRIWAVSEDAVKEDYIKAIMQMDGTSYDEAKTYVEEVMIGEDSVIESGEMIYSNDGFNGVFKVGDKKVIIETIYAGGYNIQCLHLRCLVKIK